MLTTRQAAAMLAAATDRAAEIGVLANNAVLDTGGHLKAVTRMDGAVLGAIDLAIRKARTAVLLETASEDVWEYCKPGAQASTVSPPPCAGGGLGVGDPSRRRKRARTRVVRS